MFATSVANQPQHRGSALIAASNWPSKTQNPHHPDPFAAETPSETFNPVVRPRTYFGQPTPEKTRTSFPCATQARRDGAGVCG